MYSTLLIDEPAPGVARITLNRADHLNAYSFRMTQELQAALDAFRDDDSKRALILTGAGGRAFCAGGDISGDDPEHSAKVAAQPLGHGREMREGMQAVVLRLRRLDKPSIAAIHGYAVAGGLALALACDLRIAGASARLGDTSGKIGLLPDEGGAWLFPHFMGLDRALKMTLLSEVYPAEEAARLGLVTEVVPDEDLESHALALASALAAKAPLAVRLVKMMMHKAAETSLEASMTDAQVAVMVANPSQDVREGLKAFREKRPPKFEGR
ncbi:enoyl-CoA hydratase/carnithine racemase [Caulobacter ginsengisoli]|uniref:Enoyl-CoA hydratase/carnithine racemase n=1 Tax=Caulobacter ginsengisoli TaxID=400775 RepID=A0ABU0IKP3_9CAUL|nr:enoyl-CoA hydratase/isomerase family protein [Caulobacter ginsengisoli]MDQ0462575.1 enoyl-CoA hydratase/carnithine racemase [Caulobacter ginsengisoli]